MPKRAMEETKLLETALQAVSRLGFQEGDILESAFWDVPMLLERLDGDGVFVVRLHSVTSDPSTRNPGARFRMRYLPSDVRKRMDLPTA
jgi:hypothetical protein